MASRHRRQHHRLVLLQEGQYMHSCVKGRTFVLGTGSWLTEARVVVIARVGPTNLCGPLKARCSQNLPLRAGDPIAAWQH
jgi:hypothetical protein